MGDVNDYLWAQSMAARGCGLYPALCYDGAFEIETPLTVSTFPGPTAAVRTAS